MNRSTVVKFWIPVSLGLTLGMLTAQICVWLVLPKWIALLANLAGAVPITRWILRTPQTARYWASEASGA